MDRQRDYFLFHLFNNFVQQKRVSFRCRRASIIESCLFIRRNLLMNEQGRKTPTAKLTRLALVFLNSLVFLELNS